MKNPIPIAIYNQLKPQIDFCDLENSSLVLTLAKFFRNMHENKQPAHSDNKLVLIASYIDHLLQNLPKDHFLRWTLQRPAQEKRKDSLPNDGSRKPESILKGNVNKEQNENSTPETKKLKKQLTLQLAKCKDGRLLASGSHEQAEQSSDRRLRWEKEMVGPVSLQSEQVYYGMMHEGMRSGYGLQLFGDESLFEGFWYKDRVYGLGLMIFADGDYYFGDWVDDKMQGLGVFDSHIGYNYTGQFHNNDPQGLGEEKSKTTSTVYKGAFVKGEKRGRGRLTWDGGYFEGEFEGGKASGRGVLTLHEQIIEGEFCKGSLEGPFTMHFNAPSELSNSEQTVAMRGQMSGGQLAPELELSWASSSCQVRWDGRRVVEMSKLETSNKIMNIKFPLSKDQLTHTLKMLLKLKVIEY